ncbi:hypothetical protein WJX75_009514 [Coccomyxa subellipsoidea]|uniref:Uncharacterized protein n=1 Tax=Coccomyxa subellipsoidea TaxID=248742 RepID=A0ABR2YWI0_9CHLO
MSIFSYLYASVGRADDGHMIFLADMMSPRLLQCVGPCPALLLPFVQRVTHIFRVLAARNLDEVGIDDKVIARMGKWNYEALSKSYLMYFKPQGLLAAGGWPGAAQNDYDQFWHPRFCVSVPRELVDLLFPFLRNLEQTVKELGKDATNSMKSVPAALDYLAVVVVQDALEDAERYPDNPVHVLLLASPVFRKLLDQYEDDKAHGRFDRTRPMTAAGHMREMQGFMIQLRQLLSQSSSTHAGLSAYSPVRGRSSGGHTYASELASQQRAFRQLEDTVAREGAGTQGEAQEMGQLQGSAATSSLAARAVPLAAEAAYTLESAQGSEPAAYEGRP